MNRNLLAFGFACACSGSALLSAQAQQTQPPPTPTAPAAAMEQSSVAVTVEGCLMREADVPGRTPPPADVERVKRDDDYVLTQTTMIKGSAPAPAPAPAAAGTPVGTSGAATSLMFKVEKLGGTDLNEHRGKRVQIDGTFRNADRADNTVSPATDLVKLDGTAIRPVAGDCPAK